MKGAIEVPLFPYAIFQVFHGSVLLQAPAFICFPMPLLQESGRKAGHYENQDSLRERVPDP